MTDSVPQRLETLSAQFDGLETAAASLGRDPSVGTSVRRIARSLESAAQALELKEVAAGAMAIQRAADAHLERSVANFLARVAELRDERPTDQATILIVEDNKTVATATKAYLRADGRELLIAESAEKALETLEEREVDLVILDLILPDRDGRDVLVQMREAAATAIVPVIVLSSNAGAVARAECMAVGADDFLEKPADPKALRSAAARHIKAGRERRDAVRDGLTGLPNRAGLLAHYEQYRRQAAAAGVPLTVAVLSLDPLAEVTMRLGQDAGDRFLLEVSAAVHEAIGKGDHLGRWETSELVAVLPDRTATEAKRMLETTIHMLARDDALDEMRDARIDITLSGGVATVGTDQPLHDAISSAQRSLYSARAAGGDAVHAEVDLELKTHRVLMVEDDRVTSTLLHHRLVREGHEVVAFEDGRDAYDWAADASFDLAILDVKVPGMDGFELLARLRDIPRYVGVPIVMLTGMGSEADVVRGLELGADDYMLKPFSPTELLARVRRLLHAHPGQRGERQGRSAARVATDGTTAPLPDQDTEPDGPPGLDPPNEAQA
ncbi:MAG: response regulator [Gemmatimonadetes bacterium]|nr:response regulator [Gemmatimonadota bacterium]